MKVQPINTTIQTVDFRGAKIRNVRIKSRLRNATAEQQQERNYMQAIAVALAFIAAAFTKCIIDVSKSNHNNPVMTETVVTQTGSINENTYPIE